MMLFRFHLIYEIVKAQVVYGKLNRQWEVVVLENEIFDTFSCR